LILVVEAGSAARRGSRSGLEQKLSIFPNKIEVFLGFLVETLGLV
jgi:hypothetical protein